MSTVADEINRIEEKIAESYEAIHDVELSVAGVYNTIVELGGKVPSEKTIGNLSTAIRSITGSETSGTDYVWWSPRMISNTESKSSGLASAELQEKTVSPATIKQVVTPDDAYDGLSKVTVNAAPLQSVSLTPTTSAQSVTPDNGNYGFSSVHVSAVPLQEKTVTPTTSAQNVTPDSNYLGLSKVTVNAAPPSGTDTSDATATTSDIKSGKTAYVNGSKVTGSMSTVSVPTPSITVSSNGLITASNSQSSGYTAGGSQSGTKQLTTQSTKTWTPTTSNQTIASGTYLTGAQTIKGDSNLIAGNIKSGISIFGVTGSLSSITSPPTHTVVLKNNCESFIYYYYSSFNTIKGTLSTPGTSLDAGASTSIPLAEESMLTIYSQNNLYVTTTKAVYYFNWLNGISSTKANVKKAIGISTAVLTIEGLTADYELTITVANE